MKELLKIIYIKLYVPVFLKVWGIINQLYFSIHIHNNKKEFLSRNKIVNSLTGKNILILAPHIDDELIGCGGAILKYLSENKNVSIIYMTLSNLHGKLYDYETIELERRNEAIKVWNDITKDFGNNYNIFFMNTLDGELLNTFDYLSLDKMLRDINPDTIFLPCLYDYHIDHFAVTDILFKCYCNNKDLFHNINLLLYECNSTLTQFYSNTILDITDVYNKKMTYLMNYKSQSKDFKFCKELNKINGKIINSGRAAENYIYVQPARYFMFYESHSYVVSGENKCLKGHFSEAELIRSYRSSYLHKKDLVEL